MNILQQIMNSFIVQDLSNTPGFIYAFAYLGAVIVYISTNPRRRPVKKIWWRLLLIELIMLVHMYITRNVGRVLFIPSVLFSFVLINIMILTSCKMNFRNIIYHAVRAYTLGEFMASLEWQMFYYGIYTLKMKYTFTYQTIMILIFIGGTSILMFFVERYINRDHEHLHIERQEVLITIVIGVTIYGMSNLSYMNFITPFSTDRVIDIFIIRTLVDIAGLCILTAYQILLKETHTRLEMGRMEVLYRMQYTNYQISKESVDLVNRKYHDLKHQIAILRTEISQEDKINYLDSIADDIRQYEAQNKTGNEVLDVLLTTKNLKCQKLGITMTCVADGKLLKQMNPMDISAIFGNALDYAVAEVSEIAELQKRLIHVMVSQEKNFLIIKIENFCKSNDAQNSGWLTSSRNSRRQHSVGVKSIKNTVEKYGGSLMVKVENNWHEIRILIPYNDGIKEGI